MNRISKSCCLWVILLMAAFNVGAAPLVEHRTNANGVESRTDSAPIDLAANPACEQSCRNDYEVCKRGCGGSNAGWCQTACRTQYGVCTKQCR